MFDNPAQVEEYLFDQNLTEVAVQDRHGTLFLLAVSSDVDSDDCVFYQGVPQGEDGFADAPANGWLYAGVMADGPSWPLSPLVPLEPETLEEWSFEHRPILSMRDGSIAACKCMDRVFINGQEDWDRHIAESLMTLLHPNQPDGSAS